MSEKSYISMEQHVCPVCGTLHDTGALLIDRRLRASMDRNTVTGESMCPEHQQLFDNGYLALVEVSNSDVQGNLHPSKALRTGVIAHIRRSVANEIFNVSLPDTLPLAFVDSEVIAKLQSMMPHES